MGSLWENKYKNMDVGLRFFGYEDEGRWRICWIRMEGVDLLM